MLVAGPGVLKLIMVRCLSAVCLAVAGGLLIPCGAHCGFSPRRTGVVLAAVSVGMLIGDVVVGRVFVPAVRERLVLPLPLPLPLPLLVMGIPSLMLALDPSCPVVAAACVVTGTGSVCLFGLQWRFLEGVPAQLQGQGFALLNTTAMSIQGVGPLVFGVFAGFVPVGVAIAVTGVGSVATVLLLREAARPGLVSAGAA
ncbi:MFS transporter [Streptomyces misionensis]|uniref:hypothetical protein n=1 Tax=Streptomyces misionensis TaxID=67331 RepID=UPI0033A8E627